MEILSYVLSGTLAHEDSLGHVGLLKPGDVQRMSAGTGVKHSEFNGSDKEGVHFLQVWIVPDRQGAPPRYDDKAFPLDGPGGRRNRLQLIASPDGAEGSLTLYQDARVYASVMDPGKEISLPIAQERGFWVQVAKGTLSLGHGFSPTREATVKGGAAESGMQCAGEWAELAAGDGAAVQGERNLVFRADSAVEALIFDLP